MAKIKVDKIKVGDVIGTPGDRKVRTVWGRVDKIERESDMITFCSKDWATESQKKYGSGMGCYFAMRGESLQIKPKK
jgi:hypothetical protein